MKELIMFLLLIATASLIPNELDTIWYRYTDSGNQDVEFTPDDRYIALWRNELQLWDVNIGEVEFKIQTESTGDFNYNNRYLVFAQDNTPMLLDWRTREVVEGFAKLSYKLDRIKTAKSKNEFMAKQQGDSNNLFFWDIDTKIQIDEFNFGYSFDKEGYKWKRTLHEYGYVGNNDQYFYVIISDANNVLENIPSDFHEHHYYVNFYNRETKELVDSVYSFTNTNEQFGGFNKLQVMNNRDHIAWNNEGGVINFYNIKNRNYYNKLVLDEKDYIEATDIEFNNDDKYVAISQVDVCCKYIKIFNYESKEIVYYSNTWSWENISFSNNNEFLVSSLNSFLLLFPSHITQSNIDEESMEFSLSISPNPSNSYLNIDLQLNSVDYVKLDVIDMAGSIKEVVHEGLLDESPFNKQIDISNYAAGVYFIQLELNNKVYSKQFIKE